MFSGNYKNNGLAMSKPFEDVHSGHVPSVTLNRSSGVRVAFLIPAALSLLLILYYSVDIPQWDEWDTPGYLLERIVMHKASYHDFLSQHNEHRMIFPKLIFALMAVTVGWHPALAMILSWVFVVLTLILILQLLPYDSVRHKFVLTYTGVLLSTLLFTPVQAENQLFGIQISIFIIPLCLAACMWIQTTSIEYGFKVIACALMCFVATFSNANGMLLWLFGFPYASVLPTNKKESYGKGRLMHMVWSFVYMGFAAVALSLYFFNYIKPSYHPSLSTILHSPLMCLQYFVVWIGGSFIHDKNDIVFAMIIGAGVVLILIASLALVTVQTRRSKKEIFTRSYPWICFTCYGIITGIIITIGRAGYGIAQALAGRYVSFSLWVIIGLIGILYTLWFYRNTKSHAIFSTLFFLIITTISLFSMLSWVSGVRLMETINNERRQNLLTLQLLNILPHNPLLQRIYPKPKKIIRRANLLREHHIFTYDQIEPWVAKKLHSPDEDHAGSCHILENNASVIIIEGWAMLPDSKTPADFVIISIKSPDRKMRMLTALMLARERPDIAEMFNASQLLFSGFRDYVNMQLNKGENIVAHAVDLENHKLYELSMEAPRRQLP